MKIRCLTNSIRLRIRKSELESLKQRQPLVEKIDFGPNKLTYSLSVNREIILPLATFDGTEIQVQLPSLLFESWANGPQVGIEHFQPLEEDERLHILVEKDFPCKDRETEDKQDTFVELASKPRIC